MTEMVTYALADMDVLPFAAVYARWILVGVLLFAGFMKAYHLGEFAATIQLFRLMPPQLSQILARCIVVTELILGICLAVGAGTHYAAITAAALFTIFTGAVLLSWIRGYVFDCNCFGPYFKKKIGPGSLLRNAVLLGLCFLVLRFSDGFLTVDSLLAQGMTNPHHSFERFFVLTATLTLTIMSIVLLKQFLRNFRTFSTALKEDGYGNT